MYPLPQSASDTAPDPVPLFSPHVAVVVVVDGVDAVAVQQVPWSVDIAVPTSRDAPAQDAAAAPVLNVYPDPHDVDTVLHRASAVQHVL